MLLRFHLNHVDHRGSLTVGPGGPLVRFAQSPPASFFLWPNRGEAPAINAGERWLLAGSGGSGWIRHPGAVFSVVARVVGAKGVAGGEPRGGGSFGWVWGSGMPWLPTVFEMLGSSAGSRGVERWCWKGRGGPGYDGRRWGMAATEPAGDGEDGFPPLISGCGCVVGVA